MTAHERSGDHLEPDAAGSRALPDRRGHDCARDSDTRVTTNAVM